MERKAFHALLLSLAVIAGAMTITTDAHAQTNTERLATVEDNTNSIIAALSGIADAITAGFAEVMAALGAIQTGVDAIDSELGTVHGEVDAIHGEVDAIHGEVDAIHGEVDAIHGEVDAIQGDVADIGDAVSGIDDKIDAVNTAIAGAAAALTQPDPAVAAIAEGVTANSVAINSLNDQLMEVNSMLEMISTEVGVVQETVVSDTAIAAMALTELHSDSLEYDVLVSHFGNNKATDTVYKTSHKFSCEADVFLDSASVSVAQVAADTHSPFGERQATGDMSMITVDGQVLYDTNYEFPAGTDNTNPLVSPAAFNLDELSAGDTLNFAASTDQRAIDIGNTVTAADTPSGNNFNLMQYLAATTRDTIEASDTPGNDQANVSKADAGKETVYSITVEWYSSVADAECAIESPTGPSIEYEEEDETVSVTLSTSGTGLIRPINSTASTITCEGPTAVTAVRVEGVDVDHERFVSITLDAGDKEKLDLTVDGEALVADIDAEPFEFPGGELLLTGSLPLPGVALVEITYDTVDDASCTGP